MFELFVHKRLIFLSVAVFVGSLVFSSASFAAAVPTFSFSGSGLGHGVGMSQEGAMGMAKAGKSVETIMSTYYAGTTLTTPKPLSSNSVLVNLDPSKNAHSSWTIRPGYDRSYFTISGFPTAFPDDKYKFSVSSGKIIMTSASGKTAKTTFSGSSITIVPALVSGDDLDQVSDASGPFNHPDMRYRGNLILTISGTKLLLINSLNMQDYLYGVVPREMPYSRYPASSQAQAIAARSYAYQSVANGTTLYCNTYSQMYAGHSRYDGATDDRRETQRQNGDDYHYEDSRSNAAVDATKDKYVMYNGSVVRAYFAACNGDYTANITDVWGSNSLTYWSTAKTSVRDYYCENMHPGTNSGHHNWTKSYTGYTLANRLKAKGISCPSGAGTTVYVTKFTPTYGTNGWVKKVVVTWSTGQKTTVATCADNVRIKLGFSSAQFTVTSSTPLSTDCYAKNISVTGGTL
ncbi:MAG: SpoIID/LytB domain-containing protein, partial [Coriobacteriia bacterium]|nr:SpoIID/LytB domain-containing protein [Coriobacteriia bacterium]